MTDTKPRTDWAAADANDDEIADLRRRLADAELRAVKAVSAEDVAQFAFETAKRRADRFEAAFKTSLTDLLKAIVPKRLENSIEALTDVFIDEIAAGTPLDDLDVAGHIESWAEQQ